MIKFFRKIRQRLISENRFTKYLLYAIGEIVLVVIGILIALALNDYYDQQKSEERLTKLLTDVRNELSENILESRRLIEFYNLKDSLATQTLSDQISDEAYASNPQVRGLVTNHRSFYVKSNAFDRLMVNSNDIPERYDTIIDQLKTIFGANKESIHDYNQYIAEEIGRYMTLLKQTKPWYWKWANSPEISVDATDMMMNDPIYKNHVAEYWVIAVDNLVYFTQVFRSNAYDAYRKLSVMLQLPDELTPTLMEPFDLSQSVGKYVGEENAVVISEMDGRLQFKFDNGPNQDVFPFNDSQFIPSYRPMFCRFIKDKNGKINALAIRYGFFIEEFKKD